jgi:nucleoside-diphosphate-sugar epimerase
MTGTRREVEKCRFQVIVSGATGFIGRHLIPLLLTERFDVVAMAKDEAKARGFSWYRKVRFIALDFHRQPISFVPESGAGLIHLAWQGLPNYTSPFHLEENLPKNFHFVKRLIESGVSKVLVSGTCLEYGLRNGAIPATATTNPTNPYAQAKDKLRQHLGELQRQAGFILQWARLFYLYGAGQNPNAILAQLDAAIDNGEAIFNMSGGEQLRDYLPVEAAARQLLEIFRNNESGVFNVCSGTPISIRHLVEERIRQRGSSIRMNLGHYPYLDYEPMEFWGEK